MSIKFFNTIQKQAAHTSCPKCSEKSLQANLRCDITPKDCIALLNCSSCGQEFSVNEGTDDAPLASSKASLFCEVESRRCYLLFKEKEDHLKKAS